MAYAVEAIRTNRNYFADKLNAEKQRNDVLHAVENQAPFDFVLIDTRGKEPFAAGHIPGAVCIGLEDLPKVASTLPKDKEVVTYCWGHD